MLKNGKLKDYADIHLLKFKNILSNVFIWKFPKHLKKNRNKITLALFHFRVVRFRVIVSEWYFSEWSFQSDSFQNVRFRKIHFRAIYSEWSLQSVCFRVIRFRVIISECSFQRDSFQSILMKICIINSISNYKLFKKIIERGKTQKKYQDKMTIFFKIWNF